MSAALAGILGYLGIGALGIVLGRGRIAALLALVLGAASLALWAPHFPEELVGGAPFGIALAGDLWALGIWALALVLHVAVLLHGWHKGELYHALITVLIGTCLAGGVARDLFNLYVILELASLLSVILVAKEERSAAVWAALRYLVLAGLGMIFYLFGLGLVYGSSGVLSVSALASAEFSSLSMRVGVGLILAGTAVKTGVFLLGLWLPQAHGQAPTEVSALLSGLVVKLGVVTMARLSEAFPVSFVLLALGAATGLGGLLYLLWEQDLKVMLAHSTVSQLGYMLFGLGLGSVEGALVYTVAHGLFKALLFLSAGEAVGRSGKRLISEQTGEVPWPAAVGLALGSWAIAGLPPLGGYAAKGLLTLDLPTAAKGFLLLLAVGTSASFAKLIPLFRPRGPGNPAGLVLLLSVLLGAGVFGFFRYPALLSTRLLGEAFLPVAAGVAAHPLVRRTRPALPRLNLDHAALACLLGSVLISFWLVLL